MNTVEKLNIETKEKILNEIETFKSRVELFDKRYQKKIIAIGKARGISKILDNETNLTNREKDAFEQVILERLEEIIYKTDCSQESQSGWWKDILSKFWATFSRTAHQKNYLDDIQQEVERKKVEIMERDLEEKDKWIEELESEIEEVKVGRAVNLSAVRLAEKWEKEKSKKIENELEQKVGELENAGNGLLKKLYEEYDKNKNLKEYIEKLEKKLYEQGKSLKENFEKNAVQKTEIDFLQEQLDLTNELYLNKIPLPKLPSKFKILKEKTKTKFQHLIEKMKHKTQELITRIEVRVK